MNSLQNPENATFSPSFSLHILLPPVETNFSLPPHLTGLRNSPGFPFPKLSISPPPFPKRPSYVIMKQHIHTFFITGILI